MNSSNPTHRTPRIIAAFVLSVLAFKTAYADAAPFSKIVVFGDSLNDSGNMVQFTGGVFPAPPSYAYGRQSNGPVWVEYLAQHLRLEGKISNYAVAGALTKPAPVIPTGNAWSNTFAGLEGTDITTQVLDYLADANGAADPAALYVLEGGANDFPVVDNPAIIVVNLVESLVKLQACGAKHVLLVNLPDLGKSPRLILGERFGVLPPGTAAWVSAICGQLNQALMVHVTAYTYPGVTITIADSYGFLNQTAADPASFGFVNVDEPCLIFGNGGDPDSWLFWDDFHPTTRGYEIFAGQVLDGLVRSYSPGKGRIGHGAHNSLNGLVVAPRP